MGLRRLGSVMRPWLDQFWLMHPALSEMAMMLGRQPLQGFPPLLVESARTQLRRIVCLPERRAPGIS
eukprot:4774084-Amphidinium_carterae.1